jgi:hypothetical protein
MPYSTTHTLQYNNTSPQHTDTDNISSGHIQLLHLLLKHQPYRIWNIDSHLQRSNPIASVTVTYNTP